MRIVSFRRVGWALRRILFSSLFFVFASNCAGAVTLSISPSTQTVMAGLPVSLDVLVSGLSKGTALGTYDINVAFDPTALSYSGTTFGNQLNLSGLGDIQSVTPGTGIVEVFELSLDSAATLNAGQASSFRLATLTFNTLAVSNSSPITLSVNALGVQPHYIRAATTGEVLEAQAYRTLSLPTEGTPKPSLPHHPSFICPTERPSHSPINRIAETNGIAYGAGEKNQ